MLFGSYVLFLQDNFGLGLFFVMAFERLKALDPYLEQLKGAENFGRQTSFIQESHVTCVKNV